MKMGSAACIYRHSITYSLDGYSFWHSANLNLRSRYIGKKEFGIKCGILYYA